MKQLNTFKYPVIVGKSAVPITAISPAATFTSTTVDDNGGSVRLTSSGAHGLTTAVAVTPGNVNLYISAGTNWTPGLYEITGLDTDTTGVAITINLAYDATLGSPTIALANTEMILASLEIPELLENSIIEIDHSFSSSNSGNNKRHIIELEGTEFYGPTVTTSPYTRGITIIQNRGVTNSQIGGFGVAASATSGVGAINAAQPTASIDTSVQTTLDFKCRCTNENEISTLERYLVKCIL